MGLNSLIHLLSNIEYLYMASNFRRLKYSLRKFKKITWSTWWTVWKGHIWTHTENKENKGCHDGRLLRPILSFQFTLPIDSKLAPFRSTLLTPVGPCSPLFLIFSYHMIFICSPHSSTAKMEEVCSSMFTTAKEHL